MPLTFVERIPFTYPSGAQTLHANFHADASGFYFASNGHVRVFDADGTRQSGSDIELKNHPAADTIWGFTKTTNSQWATLTRDSGIGIIGTIRLYDETGTQQRVANVPDVITGINQVSNPWRAPKALVEVGGNFYVRVVRAVSGNMRLVKFDSTLDVQDDDLVINNANPTALSDAASNGIENILIIQQRQSIVYGIKASDATIVSNLQTDLDSRNTEGYAASIDGQYLYVADRGAYIYKYSGVPEEESKSPTSGGGSGGMFTIFHLAQINAMYGRDLRNKRRRQR